MKRLLLVLVLSLAGAGAGAGAGMFLKPEDLSNTEEASVAGGEVDTSADSELPNAEDANANSPENEITEAFRKAGEAQKDAEGPIDPSKHDFVRLEKQFVVPVLDADRVAALVVLSVALEIDEGGSDSVFAVEPKLRDAFLSVLFTHAQSKGFHGAFTRKDRIEDLRSALTVSAQAILGEMAHGVLLTNIVRQDL